MSGLLGVRCVGCAVQTEGPDRVTGRRLACACLVQRAGGSMEIVGILHPALRVDPSEEAIAAAQHFYAGCSA